MINLYILISFCLSIMKRTAAVDQDWYIKKKRNVSLSFPSALSLIYTILCHRIPIFLLCPDVIYFAHLCRLLFCFIKLIRYFDEDNRYDSIDAHTYCCEQSFFLLTRALFYSPSVSGLISLLVHYNNNFKIYK